MWQPKNYLYVFLCWIKNSESWVLSPNYSKFIQENLWRIKPWHRGTIQDNGLVWHLWFDPTFLKYPKTHSVPQQDSQHNRPVISWVENILTLYLLIFTRNMTIQLNIISAAIKRCGLLKFTLMKCENMIFCMVNKTPVYGLVTKVFKAPAGMIWPWYQYSLHRISFCIPGNINAIELAIVSL